MRVPLLAYRLPGELPPKVDEDPEWRAAATYSLAEVELGARVRARARGR